MDFCEVFCFVKFTLSIYPFHVCKYNVMYLLYKNTHTIHEINKLCVNKPRQKSI